ncbi:Glycosyltransferase involved in cell wall bisynthesis [Roseomonas rosea]|uniref:Glycosyltransferase involved in cell wall bisynthesis n=1 Tax=Muricoccus roseus TaxID=198092 RepID=A0A1M6QR64_9PROT|nr:glycosyltransferase family 4 protein [Roseomonas rosea]SHK22696.1 Glycosyltransferase involved in cell wall bisynthesis [Roseomonas rosea]
MPIPPPPVLQVLPALGQGGVERGTVEIARSLVEAGGRAVVASAGGPMVAELEAAGARHVVLPLDRKSPSALVANAGALARLAREEGVAIIHARSRFPAWSALMAARRAGVHFVTTYHGSYNEGFPGKRFYNSVMARGERVIAISEHIAALVRERHGVPAERLRVIPRGVDPVRFDPAAVEAARVEGLRRGWGLPEGRPVLLLPARLTRWKGQAVLLRAVALLEEPRPVVVFAGDAQGREAYRAELEALAVESGVVLRLAGAVADMPAALALADVVVHASTDAEAFGRTVIEAQAMGRPVIASDLGAPRETVEEGVTGWRVAPGDPAALARAISHALAQPAAARVAMGEAARAAVLARYTTRAMQEATLALYREVAG